MKLTYSQLFFQLVNLGMQRCFCLGWFEFPRWGVKSEEVKEAYIATPFSPFTNGETQTSPTKGEAAWWGELD